MGEQTDDPKGPRRRRSVARAVGRAIGDAGLTVGISAGLTHGRGGGSKTHLDARAALFDEGARDYDSRTQREGLIDKVPGWLLLLAAGVIVILVLVFTSWQ